MRLLLIIGLWLPIWASAQSVFPLSLSDLKDHPATYRPAQDAKGVAIVFLLPDCPSCQSYSKTLNDLYREFQPQGLEVIGVFPGKYASFSEVEVFRSDFRIAFPLFVDKDQGQVRKVGAAVAPEVFLFDRQGHSVYSGRIDDWMVAPGKKRLKIRNHELRDAMKALCEGRKVTVPRTIPIGCIIEQ